MWSEIEGDTWNLPAARTKNGLPCLVPLSTIARDILDALPRISDYLFTTGRARLDRPISGWAPAKARLDELSGVTGWRLHDLRRTLVTGMNEKLGIDPHVVEAVVNHVSGSAKAGVAGIYNRATYLPQRTAALEAWARHVVALVEGTAKSNVVDLRR